MEMRFVIVREEKLIMQTFSGELTYKKWVKSAEAIWEHPEYDKLYSGLIDFRNTDVRMGVKEIKSIVALLAQKEEKALRADTVILIDKPKAAALASIFAVSIKYLFNTNIATTEEGAAKKLNVDLSLFEAIHGPDAVTLVLD